MRQVAKVSLEDMNNGEKSVYAVYHDNKWSDYPYRLCQIVGRKKIWLDEFCTLSAATAEAVNAAKWGYYP